MERFTPVLYGLFFILEWFLDAFLRMVRKGRPDQSPVVAQSTPVTYIHSTHIHCNFGTTVVYWLRINRSLNHFQFIG